jgi:hypothetical protein
MSRMANNETAEPSVDWNLFYEQVHTQQLWESNMLTASNSELIHF